MFVGGRKAPVSTEQECSEVGAEVKYRGNVEDLEAIEVEEGEVSPVLLTELVNIWEIVSIEGRVERHMLECWQGPVCTLFQEILERSAKGQRLEMGKREV